MATTAILLSVFSIKKLAVLIKIHFHFLRSFVRKSHFLVRYGVQQSVQCCCCWHYDNFIVAVILSAFFHFVQCACALSWLFHLLELLSFENCFHFYLIVLIECLGPFFLLVLNVTGVTLVFVVYLVHCVTNWMSHYLFGSASTSANCAQMARKHILENTHTRTKNMVGTEKEKKTTIDNAIK